jgi:steroid 5-alpha reductase family enzyme
VADEQMWRFQQDKRARTAAGEDGVQGFYREGLYRYSRHPNYFCELGQWWVLYLFAVSAAGVMWSWSILGVILLTLLFDGSVRFGESISLGKYPSYSGYQRTTSRLLPWPPRA